MYSKIATMLLAAAASAASAASGTVALPDLTAGSISAFSAAAGTSAAIRVAIGNRGAAGTGASVAAELEADNDADHASFTNAQEDTMASIPAGGSRYADFSYTFPSGGTWYVRACADPDGAIQESSETNNCGAWVAVSVTGTSSQGGSTAGGASKRYVSCTVSGAGLVAGTASNLSVGASTDQLVPYSGAKTGVTVTWGVKTYTQDASGIHAYEHDPASWTYSWSGSDGVTGAGSPITAAYGIPGKKTMSVTINGTSYPCGTLTVGGSDLGPTASLTAAPATVAPGGSATLSWKSANARYCTMAPNTGASTANGSVIVAPKATTTYTLTCKAKYAPLSSAATTTAVVMVEVPKPSCELRATVPGAGDVPVTLSWKTAQATSLSVAGVGTVSPAAEGSKQVTGPAAATYTGTVTGPGGSATCSATTSTYKNGGMGLALGNIPAHSVSADSIVGAVDDVGAGWVRVSAAWPQGRDGTYDWSALDATVNAYSARNIHILMTILGTPCWLLLDPSSIGVDPNTCTGNVQSLPQTKAWQNYVTALVKHYKGKVQYYEIWNEPNTYGAGSFLYTNPHPYVSNIKLYNQYLLLPAESAIRAADPSAKIVAPALVASGDTDTFTGQIEGALANGAAQNVDVIAVHIYPAKNLFDYGAAAHAAMTALGLGGKQLWLTEYSDSLNTVAVESASTLAAQKNYFLTAWNQNLKTPTFDKMFWFALTDNGKDATTINHGILNDDKTPRPIYDAMQQVSQAAAAL